MLRAREPREELDQDCRDVPTYFLLVRPQNVKQGKADYVKVYYSCNVSGALKFFNIDSLGEKRKIREKKQDLPPEPLIVGNFKGVL